MKKLYIIAILCILAMLAMPVLAGGDYVNKYVDNNPKYSVLPMSDYGYVEFFVRACGSAQDLTIWVAPENLNLTFNSTWYPDGTIASQNPGFKEVPVLPDCLSAMEQYSAGEYVAYLKQGNGDQMEVQKFKVGGGGLARVSFLGAAVTTPKNYCDHRYKILKASYGAEGECIEVVDVPGHTEYAFWISDAPAHTEYRFRDWIQAAYETVCHPEVNHTEMQGNTTRFEMVGNTTHQEWVEDGHYYIHDWKWFWGGWKVKCTNHAEHGEGWHFQTSACTEAYGHWIEVDNMDGHLVEFDNMDGQLVIVVDVQAYCEDVLIQPAHWSGWSDWSDTPVEPIPEQREIQTRFVDSDMYSGHYSEWSDNPEGSCVMVREDGSIQMPHEPCKTRWVDTTYKQECSDAVIDVTAEVQEVVNMGYLKFYFDNTVVPGGIFAEGGELLVTIEDPAPQYPKTAYITYEDRCGNSAKVKTYSVSGSEGTIFDLVAGTPGCTTIR